MNSHQPNGINEIIAIRIGRSVETSSELLRGLNNSSISENVHIFKNAAKKPIGYCAWINASKETLKIIKLSKRLPSFQYEWDDGRIPVLYDSCFLVGWHKLAFQMLREHLSEKRIFGVFRRGSLRLYLNKNSCFKKMPILT